MVGITAEQAIQFQLALGPAGEVFREAGEEAERRKCEIEDALRVELAKCEKNGEIFIHQAHGPLPFVIQLARPSGSAIPHSLAGC